MSNTLWSSTLDLHQADAESERCERDGLAWPCPTARTIARAMFDIPLQDPA